LLRGVQLLTLTGGSYRNQAPSKKAGMKGKLGGVLGGGGGGSSATASGGGKSGKVAKVRSAGSTRLLGRQGSNAKQWDVGGLE
jgi:hypothetical protein